MHSLCIKSHILSLGDLSIPGMQDCSTNRMALFQIFEGWMLLEEGGTVYGAAIR